MPQLSKWTVSLALAGLIALVCVRSSKAQDETAIFHADTRLKVLQVSVVDKNGKLITGLPRSAFKVYENNSANPGWVEQPITSFNAEDVPVSMGLLIDNSGSMREKRVKVAAASIALVKASNPQDEVFIVNFNDEPFLDQPFTSEIKKLEEALDRLDTRGGTAMRDAISLSMDYTKQNAKKDKKVLLIITDGNDNASEITPEQMLRKVQQNDNMLIYCIGLLSEEEPREANAAKRALKQLAEASGGLVYYPKDLAEVERITPQIAHEIRNQYVITYSPQNQNLDGSYRQIRVAVAGHGDARTQRGYFAAEPKAKETPKAAPKITAPAK